MTNLQIELEQLLNKHSAENGSDTPDFILAEYLLSCLAAYNAAVTARTAWYAPVPAENEVDNTMVPAGLDAP